MEFFLFFSLLPNSTIYRNGRLLFWGKRLAGTWNLEEWIWNGQQIFCAKLWLKWSTSFAAKILENDMKKCWQNRLKVRFQCSVPSAKKPLLAGTWSLEEWIWNGQQTFWAKLWRMVWRNADKTVSKWRSSILCLRHGNHFLPDLSHGKWF